MKADGNCAYLLASWTASVGKINRRLLRSSKSREQKKEAPRLPSANVLSAIVCAILGLLRISDVIKNSGFDCKRVFISDNYQWRLAQRRKMF